MSEPNTPAATPAGSEDPDASEATGGGATSAATTEANTAPAAPAASAPAAPATPAAAAPAPASPAQQAQTSAGLTGKPWWGAFWVTVSLLAVYAAFTLILVFFADNGGASSETVWNRYIYLLGGFEAVVFVAIGWLFGREVNRGTAQVAQQSADAAKDEAAKADERAKQAQTDAAKAKQAEDKAKAAEAVAAEEAVKGRVLADALKATTPAAALDSDRRVGGDLYKIETDVDLGAAPSSELQYLQQLAARLFPND